MSPLTPLPEAFATTRDDLHALAEHVIAPLRYYLEGHIGLTATLYGFGTDMMNGERQVRVVHGLLSDLTLEGEAQSAITTLHHAALFLRVTPDSDHHVYPLVTDGDPDRPLAVDRPAATALGEWFTFGSTVLQQVRVAARPDDKPTASQIWPEHFDLAMEIGPEDNRANVGASPGDAEHPEPYLYVGPWGDKPTGDDWNESFGASLSYQQILGGADPAAWMARTLAAVQG